MLKSGHQSYGRGMDPGTVATMVGDGLAALAIVIATTELLRSDRRIEQSRMELLNDRRVVFQLEQLVALAEALDEFGGSAPSRVRLRVQLLPLGLIPSADE